VELPPSGPEPDEDVREPDDAVMAAGQADRIAAGDIAAFKTLFDAYFDALYRFALRYLRSPEEAKDLVHDVFLQVWRHRQRIGLERDLRTYLYATARNQALDRLKHRRVEDRFAKKQEGEASSVESTEVPDAQQDLELRELAATIQRAIDSLPPRQREVLRLRWQEHLSYEEIAERLEISAKTVAVHLSRGLRHLRETLPEIAE
jgi:RNA polymerase sigma-70 factor (ECF subfamily)